MILPRRPRRVRPGQRAVTVALYLNAALLGLIVVALFTRDGAASISLLPAARAEGPAMGGGGNLYLIPGQFSERTYGCYVMDTDAQTLCVYRFDGAATTLKLIAARNFRHDRRLGHLNTVPDPKEVEVMVETERGGRKGAGGRDGAAGDDAAPVAPSVAPKSTSNPN
jgi:hypothetical protein